MSLTVLASVSLLALISSARPIPKADGLRNSLQVSGLSDRADLQQAVHAVLKSHASDFKEINDGEVNIPIRIAPTEDLQAILASIEHDAVKLIIPLDAGKVHSLDEAELVAILDRVELEGTLRTPVSDDALDKLDLHSATEQPSEQRDSSDRKETSPTVLDPHAPTNSVLVLVVASIAALLVVCCIATALYTADLLRKYLFQADMAWNILPRLEKPSAHSMDLKAVTAQTVHEKEAGLNMPGRLLMPQAAISELLLSSSENSYSEKGPDLESADEDLAEDSNEGFYDAEAAFSPPDSAYATPTVSMTEFSLYEMSGALPVSAVSASCPANYHNLPRRSYAMPEMGEASNVSATLSPSGLRPSWSVRAAEAKMPAVERNDHASRGGQRRAFTAVPEFDAALAMQLRPGLGIGADAAWLVRFVMALFGWCAVLMTGQRDNWY